MIALLSILAIVSVIVLVSLVKVLYTFIPYVVQNTGIELVYVLLLIAVIEVPIYVYMKFIRKETEKVAGDDISFVKMYSPFRAHTVVIMLIGFILVIKPLSKIEKFNMVFVGTPIVLIFLVIAYIPILLALYSVYFYGS